MAAGIADAAIRRDTAFFAYQETPHLEECALPPDAWKRLKSFWGIGDKRAIAVGERADPSVASLPVVLGTEQRNRVWGKLRSVSEPVVTKERSVPRKKCGHCMQPYAGFGNVCSDCRKGPKRGTVKLCPTCRQFFNGFAGTCEDCDRAGRGRLVPSLSGIGSGDESGCDTEDSECEEEQAAVKAKQQKLPLLMAVCSCDAPRVEGLLSQGMPVNQRNHEGVTPLICASTMGALEVVALLIRHGAGVDAVDRYGATALHSAAFDGNTAIVSALLEARCSVNHRDSDGYTALHMAVGNRGTPAHDEVAALLLAAGADPTAVTSDGFTPIAMATALGAQALADKLRDAGKAGACRGRR